VYTKPVTGPYLEARESVYTLTLEFFKALLLSEYGIIG
jgi:hypothetical protein